MNNEKAIDTTANELRLDPETLQQKLDEERIAFFFRVQVTDTGLVTGGGATGSFQRFLRDHPAYQEKLRVHFAALVRRMSAEETETEGVFPGVI